MEINKPTSIDFKNILFTPQLPNLLASDPMEVMNVTSLYMTDLVYRWISCFMFLARIAARPSDG